MNNKLRTMVSTPRSFHDAALAIASSRAGAIGVLDLGSDIASAHARNAIADLVRLGGSEIGLRLEIGADAGVVADLISLLPAGSYVVLAPPVDAALGDPTSLLVAFARERNLRVFAEVTTSDEAAAAAASDVD